MLTNLSVTKAANGWILRYSILNKTGTVVDDCDIYADTGPLLDRIKELVSMQSVQPDQPVEPVEPEE